MNKKCPNCETRKYLYIGSGTYKCMKCGTLVYEKSKKNFIQRLATKLWDIH